MKVGVLALQGDASEHCEMLKKLGALAVAVRKPYEMEVIDGLILPGGESTTVGMLLEQSGLGKVISKRALEGMPVWGTCMGAILMAKNLSGNPIDQPTLKLMNITARRNAYGRQKESFEDEVSIPKLKIENFPCVFIRAPQFEGAGPGVEILAKLHDQPVLIQEKNLLAGAFHPEIAGDARIHQYFLDMIKTRGMKN